MIGIIIVVIFAVIAIFILHNHLKQDNDTEYTSTSTYQSTPIKSLAGIEILSEKQRYYIDYHPESDEIFGVKGYMNFRIKGISYRNLPLSTVGSFKGYAVAEKNNKYDEYAIAVYNENHLHLGYLPAENVRLYSRIERQGGIVYAYGYIGCNSDGSIMYGEVGVKVNKNAPLASFFVEEKEK